uniref:Uncharacterized protein n=1 Tax=Mustela putorius furo TaxID=9669 RepID=M3XLZ8_MUSPF
MRRKSCCWLTCSWSKHKSSWEGPPREPLQPSHADPARQPSSHPGLPLGLGAAGAAAATAAAAPGPRPAARGFPRPRLRGRSRSPHVRGARRARGIRGARGRTRRPLIRRRRPRFLLLEFAQMPAPPSSAPGPLPATAAALRTAPPPRLSPSWPNRSEGAVGPRGGPKCTPGIQPCALFKAPLNGRHLFREAFPGWAGYRPSGSYYILILWFSRLFYHLTIVAVSCVPPHDHLG